MTTETDIHSTTLTQTLDHRPLSEIDPQIHQAIELESKDKKPTLN